MLSPMIRQTLRTFRTGLCTRFGDRVRTVCVFGSMARGDATDASDVDVAVVIDGLTPDEWRQALAIAADTEVALDFPFSPLVLSTQRFEELKRAGGIAADIERDGVSA